MANISLHRNEMAILREAVIKKYCQEMNKRNDEIDAFKKGLNGTLGHYEKICYNISRHLGNDKNIVAYLSSIEDSELKVVLQRWMEEKEKNPKFIHASDLWVSSGVLRKLIFEWDQEEESKFKEYFVLGCYCYAETDRNKVLRTTGKKPVTMPAKEKKRDKENNFKGTIPPYQTKSSRFRLQALRGEEAESAELQFEYKDAPVDLNRKNLDPDNNTITSKVQAQIYNKDGEWYLANCSELKTTYIQVTKPVKIDKGDIIIFGDKYFMFD